MANTLTGTPAAAAIYVQVREHAAALDAPPCLAAVSVGAQPDDRAYLHSIALSAAGCGAAAGVTYLYGGQYREIAHTIVNAIAIDSGMICDGAKASCAAKIASAVEAGLLGMQMQMHESQFYGGDGIVVKGVENTIRAVSSIARDGMRETDNEIIRLMIGEETVK